LKLVYLHVEKNRLEQNRALMLVQLIVSGFFASDINVASKISKEFLFPVFFAYNVCIILNRDNIYTPLGTRGNAESELIESISRK